MTHRLLTTSSALLLLALFLVASSSAFAPLSTPTTSSTTTTTTALYFFGGLKDAFKNDDALGKAKDPGLSNGPKFNEQVTVNGKAVPGAVAGQKLTVVANKVRVKIPVNCQKGDCGTWYVPSLVCVFGVLLQLEISFLTYDGSVIHFLLYIITAWSFSMVVKSRPVKHPCHRVKPPFKPCKKQK